MTFSSSNNLTPPRQVTINMIFVRRCCNSKLTNWATTTHRRGRSTLPRSWQQQTPSISGTTVRSLSQPSDNYDALSRFGVGGNQWTKWAQNPKAYEQLIQTSLRNGVSLLEVAGPEGGEHAMAKAYRQVVQDNPDLLLSASPSGPPLTITSRIGYRTEATETPGEDGSAEIADCLTTAAQYDGDVVVEEDHSKQLSHASGEGGDTVIHNLSKNYIRQKIESVPPLVQLGIDFPDHVRVVYMIHNPEVQILKFLRETQGLELPALGQRQDYIQERLRSAMEGLEDVVASGLIDSYGVVSNGLGLPDHHALHLSPQVLLNLSSPSMKFRNFTTVQLPLNLLETGSQKAVRTISDASSKKESSVTDIYAMRPLMSYPDLGTGTALPLELVDYSVSRNSLDSTSSNDDVGGSAKDQAESSTPKHDLVYTNEWHGPPSMYQVALQTALSHFDADPILELQAQGETLTTEQRETLEGCKLFHSMLHDLDVGLEEISSFAAHEQELYQRIIPLIYDSFEEVDDTTSQVLQAFFVAYGMAVRYQIATKTRSLLTAKPADGTDGGVPMNDNKNVDLLTPPSSSSTQPPETSDEFSSGSTRTYEIPSEMTLQEYALRFALKDPAISRVIVGASNLDELVEDLRLLAQIGYD